MNIEKFKPEENQSIENQFNNPEKLGQELEVFDIHPEKEKEKTPVVIAPGWNCNPEIFKDNILTMAKLGRRTVSINSPHGIKTEKNENYPYVELKKVAALIETLKKKGIDKIDAVGHSEAGIYLSITATLYPEKFRNIVLVNPGGMIGKDNAGRLSIDFSKDIIEQIFKCVKDKDYIKPSLKAFWEKGKSIISDPIGAVKEVFAISSFQIHGLLKQLKSQGIGISIIHSVDDKAFPMNRIQEIAEADQLDGFYSIKGTHNEFYLKPQEYTKLADQALTALAKKTKRFKKPKIKSIKYTRKTSYILNVVRNFVQKSHLSFPRSNSNRNFL